MKKLYTLLLSMLYSLISSAQFIDVPTSVCLENTKDFQLKAGGGTKYYWTGPKDFVSTEQNPTIKNLTESHSGIYKVIIDNKYPFSVDIKMGSSTNKNVIFNIYNSNSGYFFFNLSNFDYKDSYTITGPNSFFSTNPNQVNIDSKKVQGTYFFKTKNSFGCTIEKSAKFTLPDSNCLRNPGFLAKINGKFIQKYPLAPALGPNYGYYNLEYCNKATAELEIDTIGLKNPKIKWYVNDVLFENPEFKIKPRENKTYQAEITDGQCKYVTYKVKDVQISSLNYFLSPNSSYKTDTIERCSAGNQYLYVYKDRNINFGKIEYKTFLDGVSISTPPQNSYINVTKAGTYISKINFDGCLVESKPLVIKDASKPKIEITANNAIVTDKIQVCKSLYPNGLQINSYGFGYFELFKDNVNLNIPRSSSLDGYAIKESGQYELTLTDYSGCKSAKNFEIVFGETQELNVSKSTFSNVCLAIDYLYIPEISNNRQATGVTWSVANSGAVVSTNNWYFYPYSKNTYIAKLTTASCTAISKPLSTNAYYKFEIEGTATRSICKGASLILKIKGISQQSFNWYKDDKLIQTTPNNILAVTEPGEYYAEAYYNGLKCPTGNSTNKIKVEALNTPDITISKTCTANNLKSISIPSADYSTIQWFKNGNLIDGANKNVLETTEQASYSVKAKFGQCETAYSEMSIGINETVSNIVCAGDKFEYKSTTDADTYSWSGPNNFVANSKNILIPNFSKKNTGNYSLKTLDASGCLFTKNFKLYAVDKPDFYLTPTLETCSEMPLNSLLKSKPFSDTTELARSFNLTYPNGNSYWVDRYNQNTFFPQSGAYIIKGFSQEPFLNIDGKGTSAYCFTEKKVDVKITGKCSKLNIPNTNEMKICDGQDFEIPFTVNGPVKPGTIFTIRDQSWNYYKENNIDTTGILNLKTQKSPFIIPYSLLEKNVEGIYYEILSSDLTINTNPEIVDDYLNIRKTPSLISNASLIPKQFCDSLSLTLFSSFDNSIIIDSSYLYRNNVLQSSSKGIYSKAISDGNYYVKYKTKNTSAAGIYNNTCLYKTYPLEYKKANNAFTPRIEYLEEEVKYCPTKGIKIFVNGYVPPLKYNYDSLYRLALQYPSEAKFYWLKDNKRLSQFDNQNNIFVEENGSYQIEMEYKGCKIKGNIQNVNFAKQNIYILNAYVGNDYLNPNKTNQEFNICKNKPIQLRVSASFPNNGLNAIVELYNNDIKIETKPYSQQISFDIAKEGNYYLKAILDECSVISQNFIIKHTDLVLSSRITRNVEICESSQHYFYNSITENIKLTNSKAELYRNNVLYPNDISYQEYGTYYLNETGKYYFKTTETLSSGKTCMYISDSLNLKVNNTILPTNTIDELYTCNKNVSIYPKLGNNKENNINSYAVLNRTSSLKWFRNGQNFLTTKSGNTPLSVKESGEYYFSGITKEGCSFKSEVTKVNMDKIKAEIYNIDNINSDNIIDCNNFSKSIYTNVNGVDYNFPTTFEYFKDGISLKNDVNRNQINIKESGNYTVKVINSTCETTSSVLKYEKPFVPEIKFAGPIDICNGKSINLSTKIDANTQIVWEKNLQNLSIKTDNITVDSSGKYRVFLRTPYCFSNSELISIDQINLPNTFKLIGDSIFCPNKKVTLSGDNISDSEYQFLLNDKPYALTRKNTLETSEKGLFTLKYLKKSCSNLSKPIRLNHKIDIDVSATDTSFCKGNSVTLTGVANAQNTYKWYKNLEIVADANTSILKISSPGLYNLNVKGGDCESFSKTFNILEKEPLSAKISGDSRIDYGDSAKIKLEFISTPPYTVQLNDGKTYAVPSNPYELGIKPLQTKEYQIVSVKNTCGDGVFAGIAKIQVIVLGLESGKESKITVFPNPAFEGIFIKSSELEKVEKVMIEIYSSSGQKIIETTFNSKNIEEYLNFQNLNAGVYVVKVVFGSNLETFKIIKK